MTPSEDLLKVGLNIRENDVCSKVFADVNLPIKPSQVCAGVEEGGKDTCEGDSGGPIQVYLKENKCTYSIVGVTSFGQQPCGFKGSPSVYARVRPIDKCIFLLIIKAFLRFLHISTGLSLSFGLIYRVMVSPRDDTGYLADYSLEIVVFILVVSNSQ